MKKETAPNKHGNGMENVSPAEILKACGEMHKRLEKAAKKHRISLDAPGWVDDRPLTNEVSALRDKFNLLAFSTTYQGWSERQRKKLARALAADKDFRAAADNWDLLSNQDRIAQITKAGTQMMKLYSDGGKLFPPKTIQLRFYEQGSDAGSNYFELGSTARSLADAARCRISLNMHKEAGFNRFERALNIAFHEHLHAVHFSLSDYFTQCKKPERHLLGKDMEVLHYSEKLYRIGFCNIRTLYQAIPWERDAYHNAKHFVRDLYEALHAYRPAP